MDDLRDVKHIIRRAVKKNRRSTNRCCDSVAEFWSEWGKPGIPTGVVWCSYCNRYECEQHACQYRLFDV